MCQGPPSRHLPAAALSFLAASPTPDAIQQTSPLLAKPMIALRAACWLSRRTRHAQACLALLDDSDGQPRFRPPAFGHQHKHLCSSGQISIHHRVHYPDTNNCHSSQHQTSNLHGYPSPQHFFQFRFKHSSSSSDNSSNSNHSSSTGTDGATSSNTTSSSSSSGKIPDDQYDEYYDDLLAPPPTVSPTALHGHDVHSEQFKRELHSLNVAIMANSLILVAKAWVYLITGSSSILAEALHSVADVLNQLLLRIGVLKSVQAPTLQFNYGYLRDRFVWSLISAVGIFFLGAGASVIHGIHSLTDDHQVEGVFWTYLVLGISGVLEGYSLYVAMKNISAGAAARNVGFMTYVKSGVDPTTVAVFMEDGGAIVGLLIAAVGTALTHYTGNAMWDAAGSIGVGLLLGAIATFLVSKNRQLLIGRSMNPKEVQEIMDLLKRDPVVSYVIDTKTEEIGPRIFRFKAEVAWDGERLATRYVARVGRERLVERLRVALRDPDPAAIDSVLKGYGRGIINAVGAEVDRLETEIKSLNPGCHYVDLETDRGRSRPMSSTGATWEGMAGETKQTPK